jgi:uncharacterized RDD family membrane protein YckC
MVPVVGIVTWARIGVFGLGAATQHFLSGLRRERPAKPPKAPKAPKGNEAAYYAAAHAAATGIPPSPLEYSFAEPSVSAAAPVVDHPLPPPPPPPFTAPAPHYAEGDLRAHPRATFLDRLAGLAVDIILVGVLTSFLVSSRQTFDDEPYFFMMFFAYSVLFWAWQGTTLGGIVCNLRLAKADGKRVEFVDALVRGLGGVLSVAAIGIGFLWILRDPESQAWHDKIAGTIVVKVPKGTPLQ